MRRNDLARSSGFTLIELILVMALLATVMALSVPALSRSMRQRHVDHEAARFLAITEYARDEAVSQGVPMTVWIDPGGGRFGVEAKAGFNGSEQRNREFEVDPDVHFEITKAVASRGIVQAVEFAPDGAPATSSIDTLRFIDRFESEATVAKTSDGWSYEILKETK